MEPRVAYFGCWDQPGHYLHDENGRSIREFGPFSSLSLDGVFVKCLNPRGGACRLVRFVGYTLLAFIDNTVDKRPGSNSVFIVALDGLTGPQVWQHAQRAFPKITERTREIVRPDLIDY